MDDADSPYDLVDPQQDCFRPPSIPTMVWCQHCDEEYDSWRMEYRIQTAADGSRHGFWCCGIEGCGGTGFGFDIFPVDEDYVDPDGRDLGHWVEDEPITPENDFFRPPADPTPVRCEECGRNYSSADMVWRQGDEPDGTYYEGGWYCPNPTCMGWGFGEVVRPTDPNFVHPEGWSVLRPGEQRPKSSDEFKDDDIPF